MWRGPATCCHTTQGTGAWNRGVGAGSFARQLRGGGSISHSSLATSSGRHRSNAAALLMGDVLLPNPELKERGPEASERQRWNMRDAWSWTGERCRETGTCPTLQRPLPTSGVWCGQTGAVARPRNTSVTQKPSAELHGTRSRLHHLADLAWRSLAHSGSLLLRRQLRN